MIKNPFLYRAADVRMGTMVEDRFFVNLFGMSSLDLIKARIDNIWSLPFILLSAPGGGKSSLMRIFSASSLNYIKKTASIGGNHKTLFEKMEDLGAFNNGEPYALGVWLRMSDEYEALNINGEGSKHGLFCALLNSRIFLSTINAICELKELSLSQDLTCIHFSIQDSANSLTKTAWSKWGADNGKGLYESMVDLESQICDMIDDPFWEGDPSKLSHTGLWSLDFLAHSEILIDGNLASLRPLIMLDDVHELSNEQFKYLFDLLTSRQIAVPFWVSLRKHALSLKELVVDSIGRGIQEGRDYEKIDFEKDGKGDFRKRVLDISSLRVKSVSSQIGGLFDEFVNFISDEREEFLLKNLNKNVATTIKEKLLIAAGPEIKKFQDLIIEVENQSNEPHDLCKRLRMLGILIQRERNKKQKTFDFDIVDINTFQKHEKNISIVEAAELFLADEYNLPYYFGAKRLISLASFNIQQFLTIAGRLFEEIMTAIRLGRDKELLMSPERQHEIIAKFSRTFVKDFPITVRHGNQVSRFVQAIGDMCRRETYRPTAPYAPGVTGTAITMNDFDMLIEMSKKNDPLSYKLHQTIESAVAHNILEPESNLKCKGKEFLVLNLNRILCVHFKLPLQRGGFREQSLQTLQTWLTSGYSSKKTKEDPSQRLLW